MRRGHAIPKSDKIETIQWKWWCVRHLYSLHKLLHLLDWTPNFWWRCVLSACTQYEGRYLQCALRNHLTILHETPPAYRQILQGEKSSLICPRVIWLKCKGSGHVTPNTSIRPIVGTVSFSALCIYGRRCLQNIPNHIPSTLASIEPAA